MQERLNQYRPILAVLIVACGLMAAVTSRYDMTLFYICLGAWALLSLGCIIWMTVITRQNRRRFGRLKDSLEHIMSDAVLSLPMPSLIVRESGEVVWSNPPAKQGVFPGQELFGHNIAELVPGLDWQAEGRDIVIVERHYTVFLMHSSSTKEPLTIICLVDDNDLKHYTQEYFDSRPYVLTMLIDNYSELFTDAKENERSRTMGQIEHIIETFAEENHGLVKKLDRDRFLAVVEERYMKRVIEDRFPILNAIRAVDTGDRNNATMSIGVSPMAASLHESETISRQALDMALGRGGDQVALRQKNGYEFFGGTGRGVEKRNKVRARIMANAITEVATTCDNILIMGHRFADLDCLGAAIGMYAGNSGNALYCPTGYLELLRLQDRFVYLPEMPYRKVDLDRAARNVLTQDQFAADGGEGSVASWLNTAAVRNAHPNTTVAFRMNNLSGAAADLKLYAYGADGRLTQVADDLWALTDEAGQAVTELTDGTLYEVRVTVADGGAFDLSEAEKDVKLSVVLGK